MILDRLTITGADDTIDPLELAKLSDQYPYVEWGILLAKNSEGLPRYPTFEWMEKLAMLAHSKREMRLSGHLCGRWMRDLVLDAQYTFLEERPYGLIFQRMQLNFCWIRKKAKPSFLSRIGVESRQYIFQMDCFEDPILDRARTMPKVNAVPLFDKSGGTGALPEGWPKAPFGIYAGYAGGLGPENLAVEIARIAEAAGNERIWVDMESGVRSSGGEVFDLAKVRQVLEIAKPFVTM